MEKIIIPTDFSDTAENAAKYALQLNSVLKSEAFLFHSYILPVYATDIPITTPDIPGMKHESQKSMQKLRAKLERIYPGQHANIHLAVSAGYPEEEIPKFVEKNKASMVVMGTTGASGIKEALFGTNTASVIGKLKCPLLVIPDKATYNGIKKIVFATNFAENDFENINAVIEFASFFDAEVILLHIAGGDLSKPFEYNSIETFAQHLRESTNYEKLNFKLLESADLENGINLYVEEIKADIVAMTNRHRSFFQRFFDKSLTRKMVFHSHIPLLVFHQD